MASTFIFILEYENGKFEPDKYHNIHIQHTQIRLKQDSLTLCWLNVGPTS